MPPIKGKKNPNMARKAKANGRWKGGKSSDYRRRVAGAKKGDGKEVHHKDKTKGNNKRSNFTLISKSSHNKAHPEKGGNHMKGKKKKKK